jgi:Transglutaminase-like superfamily
VLSNLKRYWSLHGSRQGLLWEALVALAVAQLAIVCLPFRRIAAWLGTAGAESPATAAAEQVRKAQDIGWAVSVVSRRVPWDGRCLAQALAATGMLRRRGLEGTVSFGVCEGEVAEFDAHAWLRVGPCVVTGGPGYQRFKTFTTFARKQS